MKRGTWFDGYSLVQAHVQALDIPIPHPDVYSIYNAGRLQVQNGIGTIGMKIL